MKTSWRIIAAVFGMALLLSCREVEPSAVNEFEAETRNGLRVNVNDSIMNVPASGGIVFKQEIGWGGYCFFNYS